MARSNWLAVGLGLVLASAGARADESYTIKIKEPAKGETIQVNATDATDSRNRLVDPDGKALLDKDDKTVKESVYTETVLDKEPGKLRPTRLERHYEKAQVTTGGKTRELPYQGKTLIIEKKDGTYHFRIEGGEELPGEDAKQLNDEFNRGSDEDFELQKAVLPGKAVAVNETWKLDMAPLVAAFTKATKMQLDADKVAGTGKLVKVYQKDGARFGVMELQLDMPIKEIGEGKNKVVPQAGSKWTMDITSDGCIDGSRLDGTRKILSKIEANGPVPLPDGREAKLTVTAKGDSRESRKEAAK